MEAQTTPASGSYGVAGLTIDDVQVEIVGTGAILTALTEGQVDAIVFSKLRTIELNNSGYAASEITCDQFLPSFGNVLVAGDKLVAEVRRLLTDSAAR